MSTTKRITKRLLAVVLTVMMLMSMVTIGMTSASAAKVELVPTGYDFAANTKVYFDLSGLNWPSNYKVEIMLGHSTWSATYEMSKVANTDLYYVNLPSWGGATEFCVIANSSAWGDEGNSPSHRRGYASYKTAIYKMSGNFSGVFALYPNTANTTLTPEYKGTSYSDLNANQNVAVQSNISGAYAADTAAATVAINTYKLTGNSTAGASTASGATATASAARGANVTLSYSDVAENYTFAGWYEGDTLLSTDATYTYNYDGGATNDYTARFEYTATEVASSSADASEDASEDVSSSADASSSTDTEESQPASSGAGTDDPEEPNGTAMAASDWFKSNGLYAYAGVTDTVGPDAWQRWDSVSGKDYRYFYLPATASDTEVIIYNNYSKTIEINGVKIDAQCYNTVPYVNGTVYDTTGDYSVKIMKSDAEGAIYINNAATEYKDENKNTISNTDLYSFLTGGTKNREAKGSGAVVSVENGIIDYEVEKDGEMIGAASVKKIKGRGNSTWNLAKKPFNITFNENIQIDGMKGKKWSLLANAQDPSLLRNRLVYDLANEVHMTYACDSRFVDWFVNGDYKGSYQLTQKIEMGKNTVMPDLEEPEVEDVIDEDTGEVIPYPTADFDFILELDTAENASGAGDLTFTTSRGQVMTHKTPDEPAAEQVAFMKAKYQAVEDALYTGDIATLEKLVDLDDFARAYLINEVAKNLDAGVTSCYFTYNSETGMFTTAPVWDYDNALGNSVSISGRHDASGKMLDVTGPTGWYARDLMHYDLNVLNVFGQACATTSKNAAGETFNDVVKRIWNDEFMPALAVLEGTATAAEGRLGTVAGYMANLKNSGKWNYDYAGWALTANNGWVADHSSLVMYDYDADANTYTTSNKTYDQYTLEGQANYAGDWLVSRMNWMAAQYNEAEEVVPAGSKTVYVGVITYLTYTPTLHYWNNNTGLAGDATLTATGETEQFAVGSEYWSNAKQTFNIYKGYIPAEATGMKTWDGNSTWAAEEVTYAEDQIILLFEYSGTHHNFTAEYVVEEPTTSEATEGTVATDGTEGTTATSTAGTTASDTEGTTEAPATTKTVYFQNNWLWTNVSIHMWSADGDITKWPGAAMTKYGNDGTYDIYVAEVPANATGIIFNGIKDDGSGALDQSPNIEGDEIVDGRCYYMKWADGNSYGYEPIEIILPPDEEETTNNEATEGSDATDATEGTASVPASSDEEETTTTSAATESTTEAPATTKTVYFQNNWNWTDVRMYAFDADGAYIGEAWPGAEMTKYGNDGTYDIYVATVPANATGIIFNGIKDDGSGARDQSPNIEGDAIVDGRCYYMKWDNGNSYGFEPIEVILPPTTTSGDVKDPVAGDASSIVLRGTLTTWDTNEPMIYTEDTKVVSMTLTLAAGTYEFKLRDKTTSGLYYSNTGTIEDMTEGAGWTMKSDVQEACKLQATGGQYTFLFNLETKKLRVEAVLDETPGTTSSTPASSPDEEATVTTPSDTGVTVYVVNSVNWDKVQAYAWTTDPAVAWPGEEMTLKGVYGTFNVYEISFDEAYANIIFNNKVGDTGAQTADLELMDGYYYDLKTAKWYENLADVPAENPLATNNYLTGSFNGWNQIANEFMLKEADGTVGYVTLTLDANTKYEFKVIRAGAWTSNSTPITDSVTDAVFSSSVQDNATLTTKEAGEYVFAYYDSKLSVTYPEGEDVTDPSGTTPDDTTPDDTTPDDTTPTDVKVALPGSFNGWDQEAFMADNGDGTYTTVLNLEADTYTFKVKVGDTWYGKNTAFDDNTTDTSDVGWTMKTDEDDATLNATGGTYTFIFNTTTEKLIIEHIPAEVVTPVYNITVLNEGNFTVNAPATLDEGAILEFTVEADEDYVIAAVIANMVELVADENSVYNYGEVYSDVSIIVVAVEDTSNDTEIIPTTPDDTTPDDTTPEDTTSPVDVKKWTVMFVDDNNNIIAVAKVADGTNLPAPQAPEKAGYTFTGWSQDTSNVTKDMLVVAQYKKNEVDPPAPATIGRLQVEVSGGTGSVINGRPQGTSYLNTKMTIGTSVTIEAKATSGATFVGWLNAANNLIITTDTTYTFTATGNDSYKALYLNDVEGVNVVRFMNDKSKQILDMQYYAAGETIVYPEYPGQAGYKATGWNMTEDQIQAALAAGNDVTVSPTWERVKVYVSLTVNNGTVTAGTGPDGTYTLAGQVTATANAPEAGMKFAYWVDETGTVKSYDSEYVFFVVKNTVLTPVYIDADEEIEYKILVNVDAIDTVTYDSTNATYYSWYVPEAEMGIKYVKNGIVSVNKNNYNEATFVAGSTDTNVYDRGPSGTAAVPVGSRSWTKSNVAAGDTWMCRAYVQYTINGDASGTVYTVYSDIVEATRY